MKAPFGLAGIDSGGALVNATSRALKGEDFPALGHPAPLQYLVSASDMVPQFLRRRIYAAATGFEGISHKKMDQVDLSAIAQWATDLYEDKSYPAVIVGSSSGAMSHLAAALRVPILPQTFMIAMRRQGGGIDDPKGDLEHGREGGERLLAANPEVQLHQMHDPSQDRLSLRHISYYRTKYRVLPSAYREFIANNIAKGGTIFVSECERRWPTTRVDERYHFQFGAVGGMEPEEYQNGSQRVAEYLEYYNVGKTGWDAPEPNDESPEAEWGFEHALRDDIETLAVELGLKIVRISFAEPDDLSPLVADFYRNLQDRAGEEADHLLVSSFILTEPWIGLQPGIVPYWATFNSGPSLEKLRRYLEGRDAFRKIGMMIFPHGTQSVGLPEIDDWKAVLERAAQSGEFFGVNPKAYPHHFSGLARYHTDATKQIDISREPLKASVEQFMDFARARPSDTVQVRQQWAA